MPWFYTVPSKIEAIQWTGLNFEEIRSFCPSIVMVEPETLHLKLWLGETVVHKYDWIILWEKGQFYSCSPMKFKERFSRTQEKIYA